MRVSDMPRIDRRTRQWRLLGFLLPALVLLIVAVLAASEKAATRASKNLPKLPPGLPEGAHKPRKSNIALKWPAKLPPSRKTMPAYRLLRPSQKEYWEQRKSKIRPGSAVMGGGYKVTMFSRGAIRVFPIKKPTAGTQEEFPASKDCKGIAEAFLREMGLWEKNAVFGRVVDNTNGGTSGCMSVGYGCRLNGAMLTGPGARIIVDIGRGGRIVTVYKCWPVVEKIGDYPVISPSEAVRRFNNGEGCFLWGARGKVQSLALTYNVPPRLLGSHLVPMYVVVFRLPGSDENLWGFLPGVKKEYLKQPEDKSSTTKPSTRAAAMTYGNQRHTGINGTRGSYEPPLNTATARKTSLTNRR